MTRRPPGNRTRTSGRSILAYSPTVSSEFSRAPSSSAPPKVLEAVGCHVGVPNGVLDVLVPEIVLQGPRVVAIVGELEPTGMTKHVRVDREWHLGGLADALDEAVGICGGHWCAELGSA